MLNISKSTIAFDIQILHSVFLIKTLAITSLDQIINLDRYIGYKFELLDEINEMTNKHKNLFEKMYHEQLLLATLPPELLG